MSGWDGGLAWAQHIKCKGGARLDWWSHYAKPARVQENWPDGEGYKCDRYGLFVLLIFIKVEF